MNIKPKYYFINDVYCTSSMSAMEKALLAKMEVFCGWVVPSETIETVVSELKISQEDILKQKPRLKPVEISFSQRGSEVHFISIGSGSVTLRVVERLQLRSDK